MIGRQVIETNRAFTLQGLEQFMREHWDTREYNDFIIGRPTGASIEEYILLPATPRLMVIVYSRAAGGLFNRKDKVILSVCDTPVGAANRLCTCLPSHNVFYHIWSISTTLSYEKERKGPAEEALQKYAAYMRKLLKSHELTK